MPSLGAYTGGLNILDDAVSRHFSDGWMVVAVGDSRVHMLDRRQLTPDRTSGQSSSHWRL